MRITKKKALKLVDAIVNCYKAVLSAKLIFLKSIATAIVEVSLAD